ncbi:MAG TPA: acyl carrier protein [Thermoanaerobaculia bacterium]|jgi:acyl carrier protein|nr:acyl carrier protein [Thermoanaerobaculia bacterium]
MDASEVRNRIKTIIGSIAGIDPQRIGDDATLRGELSLDSLSLLEIGVDVDLAFQLNLPDESYKEIDSLQAMVELVMRRHAELAAAGDGEQGALAEDVGHLEAAAKGVERFG